MEVNDFEKVLNTLDEAGALPYVLITGSWCQYLYSKTICQGFQPSFKTRDIDIMYRDLKLPEIKLPVIEKLKEQGFILTRDYVTEVTKFVLGEDIELEFLTKSIPSNESGIYKIPALGIKAEGLRVMNILTEHICEANYKGKTLYLPKPSAFVIQKILAEPKRTPEWKKEKDIATAYNLFEYIKTDKKQLQDFKEILDSLTKKQMNTLNSVIDKYSDTYFIDLSILDNLTKDEIDNSLDER